MATVIFGFINASAYPSCAPSLIFILEVQMFKLIFQITKFLLRSLGCVLDMENVGNASLYIPQIQKLP